MCHRQTNVLLTVAKSLYNFPPNCNKGGIFQYVHLLDGVYVKHFHTETGDVIHFNIPVLTVCTVLRTMVHRIITSHRSTGH